MIRFQRGHFRSNVWANWSNFDRGLTEIWTNLTLAMMICETIRQTFNSLQKNYSYSKWLMSKNERVVELFPDIIQEVLGIIREFLKDSKSITWKDWKVQLEVDSTIFAMPCIWVQYGPVVCHHSCSWNIEMVNELIGTLRGIIKKTQSRWGWNGRCWSGHRDVSNRFHHSACWFRSNWSLILPFQGQDKHIQNSTGKSLDSVGASSTTGGFLGFANVSWQLPIHTSLRKEKKLSVTRQTWKTIQSDTCLSPKNHLQLKCFRKSSQRLGKTLDTLKPAKKWARSAGFLRIATWWCLPQAPWFHKTKYHLTDLKFIYSFILHEIPGVELYEIPGVEPMWTSSTVPSSHAIDLCAWCWRRPRHGRVLAPTRPDRNRGNQREGQSFCMTKLHLEWLSINKCIQTQTPM